MRRFAALIVLWSTSALADTPRGTYTLDRGGAKPATNADGAPYPSCGGQKLYGGQATFVVDYRDKVRVNGRPWRFRTIAGDPGRADSYVIINDPETKDQIWIWFHTDGSNATGYLSFATRREGKLCVDAWELRGKYDR